MKKMEQLFNDINLTKRLVLFDIQDTSSLDIIQKMSNKMLENELVTKDFKSAIIEREKNFPTGLQLEKIGVAIPHTDAKFVIKQSICIAKLKSPINFKMMGDNKSDIPVKLIFMLAIKDPDKQLSFLRSLMAAFQNTEGIENIVSANSRSEIIKEFKQILL